ncbi:MAG: hypothetical protein ACKESB_00710, partial [Candidatus Hodgkinia cicadicola]
MDDVGKHFVYEYWGEKLDVFKASKRRSKTLLILRAFIAHSKVATITQRLKRARPQLEKLLSLGKRVPQIGIMRTLRLVRSKLKCEQVTAWALVLLASAFERKDGGYVR